MLQMVSSNTDLIKNSVGILPTAVYQTLVLTVNHHGDLNLKMDNLLALN